jgi:SAM-dependent MidA family methyltransferase
LNEVAQKIAANIRTCGAISFAAFMEHALYCPVYGYYETEKDRLGRHGDYYTSVSVGSLFGELLAFQFADWVSEQNPESKAGGRREPVQIVEAGAHSGELARDILSWMRSHRRELFDRLEYWIVEPSPRRREWQRQKLGEFAGNVRWAEEMAAPAAAPHAPANVRDPLSLSPVTRHLPPVRGIIFSNELLDAMPVHRLGWDAKKRTWFEWGVTLRHERFVWTRMTGSFPVSNLQFPIRSWQSAIGNALPDGFTTEVCPAAERWWQAAASALEWGRLLTIDYGLAAEEFFLPERKDGTLRAYYRHRLSGDALAQPGHQDLTAHVNFSALQAAGEVSGLETEACLTQPQFLTQIAARTWKTPGNFGGWTPKHTRQFQTLTHPEHLGRAFRVLVQRRWP